MSEVQDPIFPNKSTSADPLPDGEMAGGVLHHHRGLKQHGPNFSIRQPRSRSSWAAR